MNTQRESWSGSSRVARPTASSSRCSGAGPGTVVKVVAADTRTERRSEFAVAPARALDAFRHPFIYADSEVVVGAPLHTQEVAA